MTPRSGPHRDTLCKGLTGGGIVEGGVSAAAIEKAVLVAVPIEIIADDLARPVDALLASFSLKVGRRLPGDVGRFLTDTEGMTERRDLCRGVDVRWHRIALPHRDHVAGHDLTLGRPVSGNIELRHWFKLLQIGLQFRNEGVRLGCQLGFENRDNLRFALIGDLIGLTRSISGRLKIWVLRQCFNVRFHVGVTVFAPGTTGPEAGEFHILQAPLLAEICAWRRRHEIFVIDARMIAEP